MEISLSYFDQGVEHIKNNLQRSCFIAYDGEFTGILTEECFKHRLFDTNEVRYYRLKTEINKMIITQFGLTLFEYDAEKDMYKGTGYTFHLCPQVCGNIDQSFTFQASSLNFLKEHNFNFNKFIYQGIPYLSKEEEKSIHNQLSKGILINNLLKSLNMSEFRILQDHCSMVSNWLMSSKDETMYIEVNSPVKRYLLHHEIRLRFPNVLTTDSLGCSFKLLIYRNKDVAGATSALDEELVEIFLNGVCGFSKVISLLKNYGKPIVGHNLYLDLMLLHNQFIGPLPNSYAKFKDNINNFFPALYDTKYISHEFSKELRLETPMWQKNVLQDLYEFFTNNKCKMLRRSEDYIQPTLPFGEKQTYHEAGWDSYCTGYCFIRLIHLYATTNGTYRILTPTEMLTAVYPYLNKINIIRAAVPYMNVVGKDPPSHRPNLLVIYARNERIIDLTRMANLLSNFGAIDVKKHGSNSALIAVGSSSSAKRILSQFYDNPDYKVFVYKPYKKRLATWSSALLLGSLGLYILHKTVN